MYQLTGKYHILPGNEEKAVAALKKLAQDVKENEPGTLLYMVFTPNFKVANLPTPATDEVVFFEIYTDEAAFHKHIDGPLFNRFQEDYGGLFLHDFNKNGPGVFMTAEALIQIGGFVREDLI